MAHKEFVDQVVELIICFFVSRRRFFDFLCVHVRVLQPRLRVQPRLVPLHEFHLLPWNVHFRRGLLHVRARCRIRHALLHVRVQLAHLVCHRSPFDHSLHQRALRFAQVEPAHAVKHPVNKADLFCGVFENRVEELFVDFLSQFLPECFLHVPLHRIQLQTQRPRELPVIRCSK